MYAVETGDVESENDCNLSRQPPCTVSANSDFLGISITVTGCNTRRKVKLFGITITGPFVRGAGHTPGRTRERFRVKNVPVALARQ